MAPIFLIGFMATGKTTVGRALAHALGREFIDLDAELQERASMTVAEIFAAEGEAGFRARERDVLSELLGRSDAVIAAGGGTACFHDGLERMRQAGAVVALTAPIAELRARVHEVAARPLFSGDLEQLLREREPVYRQAHFSVETDGRPVAEVVTDVRAGLAVMAGFDADASTDAVVVQLGARSYPISIAAGALARLPELAGLRAGSRVGVVTDDRVAPHYLAPVRESLHRAGIETAEVVIAAGEASKTLATAGSIVEQLIDGGLDRESVVIALGGGVVGDLAGFAAAIFKRGIPVIQVPTTLLAMVDSAIGGKTGVDLPAGKNLVGAFWQPAAVVADTDTLASLPERERRAAFGELFKYGLIDGEALFQRVLAAAEQLSGGASTARIEPGLIRRCAAIKASIVSRDERETGQLRAVLNLGHTVGHAIEAAAGYGTLLHGECVALGLVAACRVSAALGRCDVALEKRVSAALARAGLDVDLDPWLRPEVLALLAADKKRRGSRIRFIALAGVGAPVVEEVDLDALRRILYD